MSKWTALSREAHAGFGYNPQPGYPHAARQMMTPVLAGELHKVIRECVIGFTKTNTGLMPMAIMGVERDQNLYLHPDGRWLGHYVPASVRGYPFALVPTKTGEKVLGIVTQHLSPDGEIPLFEQDSPSQPLAKIIDLLSQRENMYQATLRACKALESAGILTHWQLVVPIGDENRQINGLLRINEQALNSLDEKAYASLQGTPMQIAYAQLYSMEQVAQLTHRAALQAGFQPANTTETDMETLFGGGDDTLKFNF